MNRLSTITAALVLALTGPAFAQQPPAVPVRVDEVRLEQVQQLRQVIGNVRAVTRSRVAAIEPGHIIELNLFEGQHVKAGQPLATIDSQRLELELQQLEADMAVREAVLAERIAQVELRQSDLELIQSMHERGAVNPKELLDARLELSVAQARRDQAQSELLVNRAQAALLRQRIKDMVIVAPFDGMVVAKMAERGEWLAIGDPIVELVSTGSFDVWLDVPQSLVQTVSRPDLTVMVHVDALGRTFQSRQARIVGDIDTAARTFSLVVRIDQNEPAGEDALASSSSADDASISAPAELELAPGMSVIAWIPMDDVAPQLTVDKDAVLRNDIGTYLMVVRQMPDSTTQAMAVMVELVFALEDRYVIRANTLRPGDQVVIEGGDRLRPGTGVHIVQHVPGQRPSQASLSSAASQQPTGASETATPSTENLASTPQHLISGTSL